MLESRCDNRFSKVSKNIFKALADFIFFQQCLICSKGGVCLCRDCISKLPRATGKCLACGRNNPFFGYCKTCQKKYQADQVLALFSYSKQVKKIVRQMKFADAFTLCTCFALQMHEVLSPYASNPVLVPIPLSPVRQRYRGYNQCALLSASLSKRTSWPCQNILKRHTTEFSQVEAKYKKDRRENIKDVFYIEKGVKVPEEIILLDDVITTGATVEEATKVLKKAGAKKVVVIALAMGR